MAKYTEARKNSNRNWDAANLDRVSIALPAGDKEKIALAATLQGQSMNAYIKQAINERMEREANRKQTEANNKQTEE